MKRVSRVVLAGLLGFLPLTAALLAVQQDQAATAEELALGEKVYKAHCRSCHLPGGRSRVKRLNLSDALWRHGDSLEEIRNTITNGVEASQMQPFKEKLSADEISAVAKYVKSFQVESTDPSPDSSN